MTSCDKQIQAWLPKFVRQVGSESMATYLLGHLDAGRRFRQKQGIWKGQLLQLRSVSFRAAAALC
jgi:hypothetical protein